MIEAINTKAVTETLKKKYKEIFGCQLDDIDFVTAISFLHNQIGGEDGKIMFNDIWVDREETRLAYLNTGTSQFPWPIIINPHRDSDWAFFPTATVRPVTSPAITEKNSEGENRFVLSGDYWSITLLGQSFLFKNTKGLQYINYLIKNQGKEVHVPDLYYAINPPDIQPTDSNMNNISIVQLEEMNLSVSDLGDAGDVLTPGGKALLKKSLDEIEDKIDRAIITGNEELQRDLKEQKNAILSNYAGATGLGGRPRKSLSSIERIRKSVTKRIGEDIKKITTSSPELGHHLKENISTGTQCMYSPYPPYIWHFEKK